MKKIIKLILSKFGFLIIKNNNIKGIDIVALRNNFENLCKNYEILFSQKFGQINENLKRIDIMSNLLGTPAPEAYFIVNALEKTKKIDGDVCEFGVAQGATSLLIANEILNNNKTFHLFDSFEGLPKPSTKDILKDDIFNLGDIHSYKGKMKSPKASVINKLDSINFPKERYVIHKGFIEDIIINKENFPTKVSFAYIDFDFYEPVKITLDFLDKITDKDAIIMVDDYEWFSTGIKTAIDEFLKDKKSNYNLFIPPKSFGCFAILTKII